MKFLLKSTCSSARLGLITNVPRLPGFEMETPQILLHTKGGTVPHLTYDVLQMVTEQKLGLHIPVSHVTNLQNRIKLKKDTLANFIGMNEYFTYCSFINPIEPKKEGFHEKNQISLWTRFGRKTFSAASYMELIEDLNPDMFLMLADGNTHLKSSQKRNIKSFNSTKHFFEECVNLYQSSVTLKQSSMIGAIEGGFDIKLRKECSELVGKGPIFGVVIDGLDDCSSSTIDMKFDDIKLLLEASLKYIPSDKLRIIHGCWNPSVLLDLVDFGIDMFDSSYPYIITEQAGALIFPVNDSMQSSINNMEKTQAYSSEDHNSLNHILSHSDDQVFENPPTKKMKLITASKYHIFISDASYACDFTPILPGCTCLTCKNHTKAYIHHLINVKELLGLTLLTIHNFHHYLRFLSAIRNSLSAGTFKNFKENFQTWADK